MPFVGTQRPEQQLVPVRQSASAVQPQAPFWQLPPAGHTVLQAPQFSGELSAASQPLLGSPSQSPKPASHAPLRHWPVLQSPVACASAHGWLQAPQSLAVLSDFSQPSAADWLQSAKPGVHCCMTQPPSPQLAWATFASLVQSLPQLPQLCASRRSLSQPVSTLPSQFARPPRHVSSQPSPPQLEASTSGRRKQDVPQLPQLSGSLRSISQPSAAAWLQSPRPASQLPI